MDSCRTQGCIHVHSGLPLFAAIMHCIDTDLITLWF